MMLYAMHYYMSCISTCTLKQVPYTEGRTTKILNEQIKCVLNSLMQETTREILESLEKELRTRTKASWQTLVCAILILSICIEAVQVGTDEYIVQNTVNGNITAMTRDAAIEACRNLDDLLFKHCTDLFHGIYRTSKPKNGHRNDRGFNPVRDGVDLDEKEGLNSATVQLVDDICKITQDYGSPTSTFRTI